MGNELIKYPSQAFINTNLTQISSQCKVRIMKLSDKLLQYYYFSSD